MKDNLSTDIIITSVTITVKTREECCDQRMVVSSLSQTLTQKGVPMACVGRRLEMSASAGGASDTHLFSSLPSCTH